MKDPGRRCSMQLRDIAGAATVSCAPGPGRRVSPAGTRAPAAASGRSGIFTAHLSRRWTSRDRGSEIQGDRERLASSASRWLRARVERSKGKVADLREHRRECPDPEVDDALARLRGCAVGITDHARGRKIFGEPRHGQRPFEAEVSTASAEFPGALVDGAVETLKPNGIRVER